MVSFIKTFIMCICAIGLMGLVFIPIVAMLAYFGEFWGSVGFFIYTALITTLCIEYL